MINFMSFDRVFIILGWLCVLVILSAVGILAYWALDTRPPIVNIRSRFVKWDDEQPRLIWIARSFVRVRQCPGQIHRSLVGRAIVPLPPARVPYPQGVSLGPFEDEIAVEVPEWATEITAYRVTVEYACNPLQRIIPLTVIIEDAPIPPRPGEGDRYRDPTRGTTG